MLIIEKKIKRESENLCWQCQAYTFICRSEGLWSFCKVKNGWFPVDWDYNRSLPKCYKSSGD